LQIKKHNNKNEYAYAGYNTWVRNFTKTSVKPYDINDDMLSLDDIKLILANEESNGQKIYQKVDTEDFVHEKIVIVSDGYKFKDAQKIIDSLPSDVVIMGVNGAFANWQNQTKRLNYIVINNPYEECVYYYPTIIKHWPKCIASIRSNAPFISSYKGFVYVYKPTPNVAYSGFNSEFESFIDDYRNPVCAAICLSHKFKVKKLLILSISDLYADNRPGTEKVKDDLFIYPQQKMAHSLIDANLYWLDKTGVKTRFNDAGLDYRYASYIREDEVKDFFNG
jgi:hypothetical protein